MARAPRWSRLTSRNNLTLFSQQSLRHHAIQRPPTMALSPQLRAFQACRMVQRMVLNGRWVFGATFRVWIAEKLMRTVASRLFTWNPLPVLCCVPLWFLSHTSSPPLLIFDSFRCGGISLSSASVDGGFVRRRHRLGRMHDWWLLVVLALLPAVLSMTTWHEARCVLPSQQYQFLFLFMNSCWLISLGSVRSLSILLFSFILPARHSTSFSSLPLIVLFKAALIMWICIDWLSSEVHTPLLVVTCVLWEWRIKLLCVSYLVRFCTMNM